MRTIISLMFLVMLAGCGGSSGSDDDSGFATTAQLPPNEATAVEAIRASIKKLQVVGMPSGHATVQSLAMLGEPVVAPSAATATGEFGTCPNMGILLGYTDGTGNPSDPLIAIFQAWRQCTGYQYETNVVNGMLKEAPRLYWDGPNCSGNPIEWEAAGASYNTQVLKNGVVFLSPRDETTLMVTAGQSPQPIGIQSVMLSADHVCQPDNETQLMYSAVPNVTQTSGVPNSTVGQYSLSGLSN